MGGFAPNPPQSKPGQPPCKFDVYEQIVQVQNYIVYDEPTATLRYFRLINGQYQEQSSSHQNPRLWIPELEIGLGLWNGEFEGLSQPWLRWCDRNGEFFLTDTEAADTLRVSRRQRITTTDREESKEFWDVRPTDLSNYRIVRIPNSGHGKLERKLSIGQSLSKMPEQYSRVRN